MKFRIETAKGSTSVFCSNLLKTTFRCFEKNRFNPRICRLDRKWRINTSTNFRIYRPHNFTKKVGSYSISNIILWYLYKMKPIFGKVVWSVNSKVCCDTFTSYLISSLCFWSNVVSWRVEKHWWWSRHSTIIKSRLEWRKSVGTSWALQLIMSWSCVSWFFIEKREKTHLHWGKIWNHPKSCPHN